MAPHAHPIRSSDMPLGPRQRALLAVLQAADAELSGQELHERLKQGSQRHGLATVYRNLRLLQRSGLVRCRKLPNGESVYAPLERDDHHLTCVSCGHSEPLPICPVATGGLGLTQGLAAGIQAAVSHLRDPRPLPFLPAERAVGPWLTS